MGIILHK